MTNAKEENKKSVKISIRKHESFEIRRGWLHKGIRNVLANPHLFTRNEADPNFACDKLGLGVNMVKALRYWLKATGLMIDVGGTQTITDIGRIINEHDQYFEERGTNYIIHYLLASNKENATAWYWFYNVYRNTTIDKDTFVEEFTQECIRLQSGDEAASAPSTRVIEDEFNCLIRTYYRKSSEQEVDPEETKMCPLIELRLITPLDSKDKEYKKMMPNRDDIHPFIAYAVISKKQAVLKAIKEDNNKLSEGENNTKKQALLVSNQIDINELWKGENNIGKIFNLDRATVFYIVEKLEQQGLVSVVRTAGLDVINIKREMTFEDCLREYYREIGEVGNG